MVHRFFVHTFFSNLIFSLAAFSYQQKNKAVSIKIKTAVKDEQEQDVHVTIHPILKPLFGYIRLRLKYDDEEISPKFSLLDDNQKIKFFSSTLSGYYNWPLHNIKEYKVTDSIIYFEDMFQLFSFASSLPAQDRFFRQPRATSYDELKVQPKKNRRYKHKD